MTGSPSKPDLRSAFLRAFLLGKLTEAETEALETLALENDGPFERITAAEDDLIDAYSRGQLSARDRRRFEEHFARGGGETRRASLRQRIALSRDLATLASGRASAPTSRSFSWRDLLPNLGPVLRPAFALAAAALLAVTAWLGWQMTGLRGELAAERQAAADTRAELDQLRATPIPAVATIPVVEGPAPADTEALARLAELESQHATLAAELDAARRAAAQPSAPRTPRTTSFILALTGAVRGVEGARRLRIPAGTDRVDLQVDLEGESGFDDYRLALRTVSGDEIWSRAGVKAVATTWGTALELEVPAASLAAGDYELMVFGNSGGNLEELGFIDLRVAVP